MALLWHLTRAYYDTVYPPISPANTYLKLLICAINLQIAANTN